MTELMGIYKCNICGNIVEVLHTGTANLVCCGETMHHMKENSVDASQEKHVPVIEKLENGKIRVKVGATPHPMEEEHYIEFIEVMSPDLKYVKRKFLHPHEEPIMEFELECKCENCDCEKLIARELCNIHGLWRSSND